MLSSASQMGRVRCTSADPSQTYHANHVTCYLKSAMEASSSMLSPNSETYLPATSNFAAASTQPGEHVCICPACKLQVPMAHLPRASKGLLAISRESAWCLAPAPAQ